MLARAILDRSGNGLYFLWDNREDRRALLKAQWPAGRALVVIDELHKYRPWKTWLKGEFDKHRDHLSFLITGSARLDIYRKGGDSLQGRYHHYRLHPFSVAELADHTPRFRPFEEISFPEGTARQAQDSLERLLRFSGFPEPLVAQKEREHRRWQKERLERFFREDVRDLEAVRDLSNLQLMADLLPEKVGSLLSLNALREELEVSHRAVTHWMELLERLYYTFRVRPFTARTIRSLKKEAKAYLWDWTLVREEGPRFENLVASHLLKFCHYLEDVEGYAAALHYLRDADGREVDFLVTVDRKPWFAVEVKTSETAPAPALRYFGERLRIPFLYQVAREAQRDFVEKGIRLLPAARFLAGLI